MVARVDAVLRQELDIPDGLADPRVYVLDPCCGTGAYLVEVLKSIHATLQAKGGDGLAAHKVKLAAWAGSSASRSCPAPFVVSHLQLGLYLQNLGAPLAEIDQETSFLVPGHQFSPLYNQKKWDGRRHLFRWKGQAFPAGLWPRRVKDILDRYRVEYTVERESECPECPRENRANGCN
jgi:hypothetical protein